MNKKQFILDNIRNINSNQLDEIIDIVNKNNIKYMKNNYGIFLSLNDVEDNVIDTINEHIRYCLDHKQQSNIVNDFEKDNLQYINDFLDKQSFEPIIEKKIKKNILQNTYNLDITINLSNVQKDIVSLSKILKIE